MLYNFENFKNDLEHGREFELDFKGQYYHISWIDDNIICVIESGKDKSMLFNGTDDFIRNIKINNKKISDIWKLIDVKTIY